MSYLIRRGTSDIAFPNRDPRREIALLTDRASNAASYAVLLELLDADSWPKLVIEDFGFGCDTQIMLARQS